MDEEGAVDGLGLRLLDRGGPTLIEDVAFDVVLETLDGAMLNSEEAREEFDPLAVPLVDLVVFIGAVNAEDLELEVIRGVSGFVVEEDIGLDDGLIEGALEDDLLEEDLEEDAACRAVELVPDLAALLEEEVDADLPAVVALPALNDEDAIFAVEVDATWLEVDGLEALSSSSSAA